MNTPRVSVIPPDADGFLFERADISIVQVGDDFIPDYDPDVLDRALVLVQTIMGDLYEQDLEELRDVLDRPSKFLRRMLGVTLRAGHTSDIALAAILLVPDSNFGIQYVWEPGAHPIWPDGITFVYWRSHLYTRTGDTLMLWTGE
jgi:hypothetical protein